MSRYVLTQLQQQFGDKILQTSDFRGDETVVVDRESLHKICLWLRDSEDLNFQMLTDLTAVDYLGRKTPRFEVIYHLYSLEKKHRLRIKVGVPEDDSTVDTVCDIWKIANWLEREIWDMYGIKFNNHPDPRRILLYEEFAGHPLRKDYPKDKHQPLVRRPENELAEIFARRPSNNTDLLAESK